MNCWFHRSHVSRARKLCRNKHVKRVYIEDRLPTLCPTLPQQLLLQYNQTQTEDDFTVIQTFAEYIYLPSAHRLLTIHQPFLVSKMSAFNNMTVFLASPADYQIDQQLIDELTEINAVGSGLNHSNLQELSQYGHAQNVNRPRAATTMNPIEEEVIEVASASNTNGIIGGQHNYHGDAPLPEQGHNLHIPRAVMTASLTKQSDNDDDERILNPMMREIMRRSESLIANAAQHEHNQDVPACTEDHHNKYCGSGMDTPLMEYAHLRSLGVIPERPYEHWGCDSPQRKARIECCEKVSVKVAFRPIDWQSEYTGRGCMFHCELPEPSFCGSLTILQ